jgi:peptidoglycan/LPS O-acetylase OafA/YrhL
MTSVWPGFVDILGGSNTFPGDYLIASLVVANFAAVANLGPLGTWLVAVRRPIASIVAYTFSIYLYHMPLLALFRSGLHLAAWATAVCLVAAIGVIGRLTERNLPWCRTMLSTLVTRITGREIERSPTMRRDV